MIWELPATESEFGRLSSNQWRRQSLIGRELSEPKGKQFKRNN